MEREGEPDRGPGRVADMFARGRGPGGERSGPPPGRPRSQDADRADDRPDLSGAGTSGTGPSDTGLSGTGLSDAGLDETGDEPVVTPEDVAATESAVTTEPATAAAATTDLATFADIHAISRLKYRYLRCLDTKDWDEFADTMVPEATATYSEYLQFESREAFVAFLRNTLDSHVITEHRCDQPEIDVTGDIATGTWYLADTVLIPEHNLLMRGAAYYHDRYVRGGDGVWRIAHTGYQRTYEVVLSLSDVPSLRLTSDRWGLIAHEDGITSIQRDPRTPAYRESGTG